ncbi:MAG: hypothetical protein IKS67_06970, partial [Victivallales bacterium]|nr:hypothetical protein [Victivallales bacterium]
ELHENYGLSKTREAEDMCNYTQYLVQKGKKEGREEEKLSFLERMEALHYNDKQIIDLLEIDAVILKSLRNKLLARQSAIADD